MSFLPLCRWPLLDSSPAAAAAWQSCRWSTWTHRIVPRVTEWLCREGGECVPGTHTCSTCCQLCAAHGPRIHGTSQAAFGTRISTVPVFVWTLSLIYCCLFHVFFSHTLLSHTHTHTHSHTQMHIKVAVRPAAGAEPGLRGSVLLHLNAAFTCAYIFVLFLPPHSSQRNCLSWVGVLALPCI